MPTRKHVARHGHSAEAQQAAGAATPPAADGAGEATETTETTDDVEVLWRKKPAAATAPAAEETAAAEVAAEAGEGAGADWEARFKAEQAKADDYFARWQRAAADMANMRRRHEQDRQEYVKQANAQLIAELLPVLDSFDRALASMPPELRELTWVDGIVLVERQLRLVLERAGLTPIEAQGKPFDPTEHEALLHEASEEPEDTIIGELQRGYKLHDRVLRPALVKVAKNH